MTTNKRKYQALSVPVAPSITPQVLLALYRIVQRISTMELKRAMHQTTYLETHNFNTLGHFSNHMRVFLEAFPDEGKAFEHIRSALERIILDTGVVMNERVQHYREQKDKDVSTLIRSAEAQGFSVSYRPSTQEVVIDTK